MMTTPHIAQQVDALLEQQIQAADSLKHTLEDEGNILIKRDFEAIHTLNQQKLEQSALLEKLHQEHHHLLKKHGFSYTPDGMNSFINSHPPLLSIQLRQKQTSLLVLLDNCQKLNTINGTIIAANRHSTETALAILRGQPTSDGLTYGANGQSVTTPHSNPLIQA